MPWLCPHVLAQELGQPLGMLLSQEGLQSRRLPAEQPYRFVHLVNPYGCPAGSLANLIQERTFDSMRRSRVLAAPVARVDLVAVAHPEDDSLARAHFDHVIHLQRSVSDICQFKAPRRLPLLFDIICAPCPIIDGADYLIYTNADICLMPAFYQCIAGLLAIGFDAITVNRRTIPEASFHDCYSPLAAADYGLPHTGFDCFVFPSSFTFHRNNACLGAQWVMRGLLYNLFTLSTRMLMLTDVHLTYHLGDDKQWRNPAYTEYAEHNLANSNAVLSHYLAQPQAAERLKMIFQKTSPLANDLIPFFARMYGAHNRRARRA